MMLASDMANPQYTGPINPDDLLHVTFYLKTLQDNFKTEREGRPIFYSAPYVRIQIPGNNLSVVDTEVREEHKIRFPRQWAQFQNSQAPVQISGTPVEEWPALTRAQAEELKGIKFFTVEQIAGCSDLQVQGLGMGGPALRQKARAFLESAANSAAQQAHVAEIEKLKSEQEAKDKAHAAEIAELRSMIKDLAKGRKPKRKYTRHTNPQDTQAGADG